MTKHTLPEDARQSLQTTDSRAQRDAYITELRDARWSYASIAEPLGLTAEAVRLIVKRTENPEWSGLLVPPVPERPAKAVKVPRVIPVLSPAQVATLLELKGDAESVRFTHSAGRDASREYSRLIHEAVTVHGISMYMVAKQLGVTHGAISQRLDRYAVSALKK
jgi:predicted transcriptional regulator